MTVCMVSCYNMYTMTKDNILNIRIAYDDLLMLEKLCTDTVRTKSDMIRYLIRKEWEARQDDKTD